MRIANSATASAQRMMRTRSSARCSVSVMTSSGDFSVGRDGRAPKRRAHACGPASSVGSWRPTSPLSVRVTRSSGRPSRCCRRRRARRRARLGPSSARSPLDRRRWRRLGGRRPPRWDPAALQLRPGWSATRRRILGGPFLLSPVKSVASRSMSAVPRSSLIGSSITLRTSDWKLFAILRSSEYARPGLAHRVGELLRTEDDQRQQQDHDDLAAGQVEHAAQSTVRRSPGSGERSGPTHGVCSAPRWSADCPSPPSGAPAGAFRMFSCNNGCRRCWRGLSPSPTGAPGRMRGRTRSTRSRSPCVWGRPGWRATSG